MGKIEYLGNQIRYRCQVWRIRKLNQNLKLYRLLTLSALRILSAADIISFAHFISCWHYQLCAFYQLLTLSALRIFLHTQPCAFYQLLTLSALCIFYILNLAHFISCWHYQLCAFFTYSSLAHHFKIAYSALRILSAADVISFAHVIIGLFWPLKKILGSRKHEFTEKKNKKKYLRLNKIWSQKYF